VWKIAAERVWRFHSSSQEVPMEHVLFVQKVKPEKRQEYLEAHRKVWPDVLKLIRDSGVQREIIWIRDDTLYVYIMAENFDRALGYQGETKVFQKWLEKMRPLLSEMQDYSEEGRIVKLEKVFDLEEQSAGGGDQ
jgi:L-rhamnose mutarotase